jgi:hypothetical protein
MPPYKSEEHMSVKKGTKKIGVKHMSVKKGTKK